MEHNIQLENRKNILDHVTTPPVSTNWKYNHYETDVGCMSCIVL